MDLTKVYALELLPGDTLEPLECLNMLEGIQELIPAQELTGRISSKIRALRFRYAVKESHGETVPKKVFEADIQALQDLYSGGETERSYEVKTGTRFLA